MTRVVVAGLGRPDRGDDGAGPIVARRAVIAAGIGVDAGPIREPLDLLGRWDGADLAVIIDAVRSGARPGTVQVVDAGSTPERLSSAVSTSTHGIDAGGALRLAQAVGTAPARVVVVGIEGRRFDLGDRLSPEVAAALPTAVGLVVELIKEAQACV